MTATIRDSIPVSNKQQLTAARVALAAAITTRVGKQTRNGVRIPQWAYVLYRGDTPASCEADRQAAYVTKSPRDDYTIRLDPKIVAWLETKFPA